MLLRFADSHMHKLALKRSLSHFVIAPLPLYLLPKSPIAILIIRLMYQKSIVLENQQRSNLSERQTKETKGIFILYRYKSQGYYCSDIMIKCAVIWWWLSWTEWQKYIRCYLRKAALRLNAPKIFPEIANDRTTRNSYAFFRSKTNLTCAKVPTSQSRGNQAAKV